MTPAEFIAQFEGLAKVGEAGLVYPYLDAANKPTIGYGHLLQSMDYPPITQAEALELLEKDVYKAQQAVLLASPILADQPDRLTACTSFAFNLGTHAYETSTMRKCVDAGEWPEAARECLRWNHAGGKVLAGLTRRRQAEADLLLATP